MDSEVSREKSETQLHLVLLQRAVDSFSHDILKLFRSPDAQLTQIFSGQVIPSYQLLAAADQLVKI